jgi:hypothetical protein
MRMVFISKTDAYIKGGILQACAHNRLKLAIVGE